MCTAVCYKQFFGRNLDYEFTHGESVIFTPRNFRFSSQLPEGGYALMGVAHLSEGIPLYYDAVNEHGLAMAGLSFRILPSTLRVRVRKFLPTSS
ncbi:MAG: linear amide C-N hydrolase [Oscillospiraceae bacterium]|nr:linear amide C-N hydrolase [Oscillospiraceae bacterium]